MARRALNTAPLAETPVRVRQPRIAPRPTPEMVAKAREAFLANKEANASAKRCRDAQKELAKAMTKAGVDAFEFTASLPTGGSVQARAAIEPFTADVIDVNTLRGLVDDATFMRVIKATQGDVKDVCGEHVLLKSLVTQDKPAELKIKEVK